jgi:hypothetical protein
MVRWLIEVKLVASAEGVWSVLQFLATANVASSSLIRLTLTMEAIGSSEMSVLTTATRRHMTEDGILHSRHREKLNSYNWRYQLSNCLRDIFLFKYPAELGIKRFRHYATNRNFRCLILIKSLHFSKLPNPSGRAMVPGMPEPITEMSTMNLPQG